MWAGAVICAGVLGLSGVGPESAALGGGYPGADGVRVQYLDVNATDTVATSDMGNKAQVARKVLSSGPKRQKSRTTSVSLGREALSRRSESDGDLERLLPRGESPSMVLGGDGWVVTPVAGSERRFK
jgi:hypothetical protein